MRAALKLQQGFCFPKNSPNFSRNLCPYAVGVFTAINR
jgi:hypothetical protein